MRRSAVSVVANIAEGYDRSSDRDFIRFLYIAKASLSELRAHLDLALDLEMIDTTAHALHDEHCEKIKAMLINLIRARRTAA